MQLGFPVLENGATIGLALLHPRGAKSEAGEIGGEGIGGMKRFQKLFVIPLLALGLNLSAQAQVEKVTAKAEGEL